MAYWNGTCWVPDTSRRTAVARRRPRILGAAAEAALITLLTFGLVGGPAVAGQGKGAGHRASSACLVEGGVVTAEGLPTDEVINFMLTDEAGAQGWVLGMAWEGTWQVHVPERKSSTTYEFVSRTYGNAGSKYRVFAACTAS